MKIKPALVLPGILTLLLITCILAAPRWMKGSTPGVNPPLSFVLSEADPLPSAVRHTLGPPSAHVSGIVITTHWTQRKTMSLNYVGCQGNLMRYDLKDSRVVRKACVYGGGDAGAACLNTSGDHIAFIKGGNTIAVIRVGGGGEVNLTGLDQHIRFLQWPAGDGGQWIDFIGQDSRTVRRVNLNSRVVQPVVRFNRAVDHFGLSADSGLHSGRCIARAETEAAFYDLKDGDGDLFKHMLARACGISVSPDGRFFTANTLQHDHVNVTALNGAIKRSFGVNQWAVGGSDGCNKWQHHRWSVNSPDWIIIPQSFGVQGREDHVAYTNAVLYNWIEAKQVQVTDNPPGEFDLAQGFWDSDMPSAGFVLGQFENKAPLTADFKTPGRGPWEWSYGDGSTGQGPVGHHTYSAPGAYMVTATRGHAILYGQVTVHERTSPRSDGAAMLDDGHILVSFSEPVHLDRPAFSLQRTGGVRQWSLDNSRRRLILALRGRLGSDDWLSLKGVYDQAQTPNPLPKEKVSINYQPWPGRRSGLQFLWQNATAPNLFYDAANGRAITGSLIQHGLATFNRDGDLSLSGGSCDTIRSPHDWSQRSFQQGAFSLEMTLEAASLNEGSTARPACLVDFSNAPMANPLWLGQDGSKLVLNCRNSAGKAVRRVVMATLHTGPQQIVLSYSRGRFAFFLDGHEVSAYNSTVRFTSPVAPETLHFGASYVGRDPWKGNLRSIAFYRRALGPHEVKADYTLDLGNSERRSSVSQVEVEAKLIAMSEIPTLMQVAPYRDALVTCEFRLLRVLRGSCSEKLIRVYRWALMNGQTAPAAQVPVGQVCHLTLERLKDHPELEAKYTSDTLEENYAAEPYTDAGL